MESKGNKSKRQKLESNQKQEEDPIDRLSLLPDSILVDILSLLPLQSAIKTSVLSGRWRNLWTQITRLSFDASKLPVLWPNRLGSYLETVNLLFPLFTSPKIHSLCLFVPWFYNNDQNQQALCSSLESWISTACNRLAEQIQVSVSGHVGYAHGPSLRAPSCMFQCQSLAILKLNGRFHFDEGLDISLPNLKQLDLQLAVFDSKLWPKLFKHCPVLEQLYLLGHNWDWEDHVSLDLSTLSLKNLCIKILSHHPPQAKIIINASQLEQITLHGLCLAFLCFLNPSGALVTADVSLKPEFMDAFDYHSNTLHFVEVISSATSAHLNCPALKVLSNLNDGLLPVFKNLSVLNIKFNDSDGSWGDLLRFLRCSPNLERLTLTLRPDRGHVMKWVEPSYAPPCGLTKLKKIDILGLKGRKDDIMMIQYIIDYTKVLELLSVDVCIPTKRKDTTLWNEYELCEKLFLLQRTSTCQIKFVGRYIKLSSKGFQNEGPRCQSISLGSHLVLN